MKRGKKSVQEKLLENIKKQQNKRRQIQTSGNRDKEPNLLNVSKALDQYYFLEKLKTYCSYLSYRLIVHKSLLGYQASDFRIVQQIIRSIRKEPVWHPAIDIYSRICGLFEIPGKRNAATDSTTVFHEIENLLGEHRSVFSAGELIELHSHLTNYCIYQMNHGNDSFLLNNILHNQKIIDLEAQRDKNFIMNVGAFKNMVVLLLKHENSNGKELKAKESRQGRVSATEFINKYKNNLPTVDRKKYTCYCHALVEFQRGKFNDALMWLKELKRVRKMFINYDVKVLQLQIYLELEIHDPDTLDLWEISIAMELENFRSMLNKDKNKNKKLAYQRGYFAEFHKLYSQFYSFFNKYGWKNSDAQYGQKHERLRNVMLMCKHPYRKWFLDKLAEI